LLDSLLQEMRLLMNGVEWISEFMDNVKRY